MPGAGQPAARSFQAALLGILIENLPAMNLTDKNTLAAGKRVGLGRQPLVKASQPGNEIRPRCDHAGFVGRPHHFVDGSTAATEDSRPYQPRAADDRKTIVEILRQQDRIADVTVLDELV